MKTEFETLTKRSFYDFTEEEIAILSALPETAIVINHLERYGSITSIEAIDLYGMTRLAAVIYDIREKYPHINILAVDEKGKNRFGKKTKHKRYYYKGEIEL